MSRVSGDSGASLIELLITIVLLGVIGSVVTTTMITGMHDQTRITAHSAEMAKVRTTLDRMMRQIRDADEVLAMTQSEIKLLAHDGSDHMTYDYSVIANGPTSALVVDVQPSDANAAPLAGSAATRKTLLDYLVNTSSEPVFT